MKYFSISEAPSESFVRLALRNYGWREEDFLKFSHATHPQEDYCLISRKYPIFVVADGVTLIQYIIEKKKYPNPSPAGEIARVFCEAVIKEAEKRYENFSQTDMREVFREGNKVAALYNNNHGRMRDTLDYWDNDLHAATGAIVVVKDNRVFWASICDSYVAHFDESNNLKFKSPKCDSFSEAPAPQFTGDSNNRIEKIKYTWRVRRNGIDEQGKRVGYGVITGEANAESYLAQGDFEIKEGEKLCLVTDGFEDYLEEPEFKELLSAWTEDIESKLKNLSLRKAEENGDKFGRERTLIACKI